MRGCTALCNSRMLKIGPDFEVANNSEKVRCGVCLASNERESWIKKSSANAHTKSERHNRNIAAKRQQVDEVARNDVHQNKLAAETENLFGDGFFPVDAVPSVQVTSNEPKQVLSQLQANEETEMTRKVLRYLDTPQKEDPSGFPIDGWQVADQSLEAQVEQIVNGNLTVVDPETEGDGVLAGVMSEACWWISPRSHGEQLTYTAPDSQLPVDGVEHLAFGKSLPNKEVEWYPYTNKTVCPIC